MNVFWTFFGPDGCQFNLWDNHGIDGPVCGGPNRGNAMLKHEYCCPSFDHSFSALLDDLSDRGLLDETLVVVTGEFGRTPKINNTAGRDHWAGCQSTVLSGGGVRGGQVYGSTDAQAAYVKEHPVSPDDIGATIHHAFGLKPHDFVYSQTGRPTRITEGQPVVELLGDVIATAGNPLKRVPLVSLSASASQGTLEKHWRTSRLVAPGNR